jgi:hypothetical protein
MEIGENFEFGCFRIYAKTPELLFFDRSRGNEPLLHISALILLVP